MLPRDRPALDVEALAELAVNGRAAGFLSYQEIAAFLRDADLSGERLEPQLVDPSVVAC